VRTFAKCSNIASRDIKQTNAIEFTSMMSTASLFSISFGNVKAYT